MTQYEQVKVQLKSIEYRHSAYFVAIKKDIMDCVVIQGDDTAEVRIIKTDLPKQITDEINNIKSRIV